MEIQRQTGRELLALTVETRHEPPQILESLRLSDTSTLKPQEDNTSDILEKYLES
jgi:hypothetical protein